MPENVLGTSATTNPDASRAEGTFYLTCGLTLMADADAGVAECRSQERICLQWSPYRTCLDRTGVELALTKCLR